MVNEWCEASDHCRWLSRRSVYAVNNVARDDCLHSVAGRERVAYWDSRCIADTDAVYAVRVGRDCESFTVSTSALVLGGFDASIDVIADGDRAVADSGDVARILGLDAVSHNRGESRVTALQLAALAELDG